MGQQTFQEFCEHAGWHLAADNAQLQVFYNEDPDPVPIYTDPESELNAIQKMEKLFFTTYWVLVVMNIVNLVNQIHSFLREPIAWLANSMTVSLAISFFCLTMFVLSDLLFYYCWRKKARAAAQNGEIVPTSKSRVNRRAYWILASVFFLIFGGLIAGQPGISRFFVFYLLGICALYFIVNAVRIGLKKKKVEKQYNRAITLAVDVILAIVLSVIIIFDAFHIAEHIAPNAEAPLFTAASIRGEPEKDGESNTHHLSSVFLTLNTGWEFPDTRESLSYDVIDVHLPCLQEFCMDTLLHENDRRNDDLDDPDFHYREDMPEDWKADQAFRLYAYGEPRNTYLVRYGSRIIKLECTWELNGSEKARVYTLAAEN